MRTRSGQGSQQFGLQPTGKAQPQIDTLEAVGHTFEPYEICGILQQQQEHESTKAGADARAQPGDRARVVVATGPVRVEMV